MFQNAYAYVLYTLITGKTFEIFMWHKCLKNVLGHANVC